jgi:serine/threonine-protein kinase
MVQVWVPGGSFTMGSEDGSSDEKPVHQVTLDGFWIDRTEVTNAQYTDFLNDIVDRITVRDGEFVEVDDLVYYDLECTNCGEWRDRIIYDDQQFEVVVDEARHPVVLVTWYGARAYCEWAGGRLPTEAEWEYAARGPEGFVYPWGNDFACDKGNFDDETVIDDYVVPGGENCDGYERTSPVGSFPGGASWVGALDMAGNVWEWCADWYGEYPSTVQTNPTGPETGEYRVLRSGSWDVDDRYSRSANRNWNDPTITLNDYGFRCASPQSP